MRRLGWQSMVAAWCLAAIAQASEIQRVDPPNWWVGMAEPSLQLLVYGKDVADLSPTIRFQSVRIERTHRTGNPNYLFIDLFVPAYTEPGTLTIELQRDGETELTHDFELLPRVKARAGLRGFAQNDVLYLVTPDRFANGDPANDTLPAYADGLDRDAEYGRHGGDLQGLLEHVDYFADLGVSKLWLNPVLENAQPQWSYHGYAITDFYAVDPRFGNNAMYQALADRLRERGIGLVIDVVLNHCGSRHWWMDDLPSDDWINYGGEFRPTNHHRESLQDPHAVAVDRAGFADGWFVETMPDMNQRNPLLANYLIQNSIWWVEFAGLSGIRVDTWPYSDKAFLTDYARRLRLHYPTLGIVGEEWTTNPALLAYWQAGSHRRDGYESHLPSVFDFPLQDAIVRGLNAEEAWNAGLVEVYRTLATDFVYGDPDALVTFPDNHDMSRIFTQLDEDPDLWRMAVGMTLTLRGIPQIYYGTEILMSHPGSDSHGVIRSDFPGGWPGDAVDAFSGVGLDDEARAAREFVKAMIRLRRSFAADGRGELKHFAPADGIYSYFRVGAGDRPALMFVVNKNDDARTLDYATYAPLLDTLRADAPGAALSGTGTAYGASGDQPLTFGVDTPATVPPRSFSVITLQRTAAVTGEP